MQIIRLRNEREEWDLFRLCPRTGLSTAHRVSWQNSGTTHASTHSQSWEIRSSGLVAGDSCSVWHLQNGEQECFRVPIEGTGEDNVSDCVSLVCGGFSLRYSASVRDVRWPPVAPLLYHRQPCPSALYLDASLFQHSSQDKNTLFSNGSQYAAPVARRPGYHFIAAETRLHYMFQTCVLFPCADTCDLWGKLVCVPL